MRYKHKCNHKRKNKVESNIIKAIFIYDDIGQNKENNDVRGQNKNGWKQLEDSMQENYGGWQMPVKCEWL